MKRLLREAAMYIAASGVGLAVDVATLWLLVEQGGLHYLAAATIAFLAGTIVVYAAAVSRIFRHRRLSDRRLEFGVFAAIGALGLLVNLTVLRIAVEDFNSHYLVGKMVSIFFTFSLNFGLRRTLLFSAPSARGEAVIQEGSRE
jgi:putative flippase GtrA